MVSEQVRRGATAASSPSICGPVLVVDDEPAVLQQLADGLQTLGREVRTAGGAAEALRILDADDTICVVVADIRMPDADGLWLARQVAALHGELRAVELVVITGHATVEDATAALRSGVSDFLRKPFRLRELEVAVGEAAERAAKRRARAAARLTTERRLQEAERERQALQGRLIAAHDLISGVIKTDPEQEEVESSAELGAISHALRTPLNALSGSADLFEPNPGAAQEGLSLLRQSVTATMDAVEALEELHRIRRHRRLATRCAIPLLPLLTKVLARLRRQFPEFDASVDDATGEALEALGDPALLEHGVQLALLTLLDWCGGVGRMRIALLRDGSADEPHLSLVISTARPGREPVAWPEPEETSGSSVPRTVEGLRFLAARHVVRIHGGRLTAWEGEGVACLRVVLPASG